MGHRVEAPGCEFIEAHRAYSSCLRLYRSLNVVDPTRLGAVIDKGYRNILAVAQLRVAIKGCDNCREPFINSSLIGS